MNENNFALTTLSQHPEYFEEVIKLIEAEFHYSENNHYEIDFAPLVNPLNFENCFLLIDKKNNNVAAHLAISLRTLIKNNAELNVALIGGIVTHREYRGNNLFKKLMDHAIELHQHSVGLFILWSDLENLYVKFNFYRTGGLIETGLKNLNSSERPSGYEKTKFPSLSEADFKQIINLYENFNECYFFTVKRNDKDWSIIKDMSSIDLFIKRNSADGIEKYFCANKGRDLTNIIHEVGASSKKEYLNLLKDLENYKLWLPETEEEITYAKDVFYTAFLRLGNIQVLNTFLTSISDSELKITRQENDLVNFSFKDQNFEDNQKNFLQYVFGPKPIEEFKKLGLSMYISGSDSI